MTKNTKNEAYNSRLTIVSDKKKQSSKPKKNSINQFETYAVNKFDFRRNLISLDVEITEKGQNNWRVCNENSLFIEVQKKNIKIPLGSIKAYLKSEYVLDYHPFKDYFARLHLWDEQEDYISKYANYLILDPKEDREQFNMAFKKWCVRVVKCAIIDPYFNKQAFVLTDDGKGQNIGKSTWCRNLCPPSLANYIAEDISNNDKDVLVSLCKNLLINIDELAAFSKKEINQLKSLFSKDKVNIRLPYEAKNSNLPRVASFIGSTNMSTFLHDETGSVRWLCFVITEIDWSYKTDFIMDNLWAQAYSLAKDPSFKAEMTKEDLKINEQRNEKFQNVTPEFEILEKFFSSADSTKGEFMTATEITNYIICNSVSKVNNIQMGKALKAQNFIREKNDGRYGYWILKKPLPI
ncbi:virulence-associated E family protein [Mangrovimonas sp. AS39]|uniref:virulence-associated E family protein n=1 Tax=Mangrovimonas futianensis TaxID=2895523 RepID=UPI001E5EA6B6|nr:virulence-associated E family protein [Mangrovimonas futianensis]MCF1190097.1 virulence-associated E family protein [Mangrovimonas futianensis]MCF1194152.1 virulence-associated E family protein [Mangrovimonas futianensis]